MTMTVADFQGRTSGSGLRVSVPRRFASLLALLAVVFATNAFAENVLQDITFAPLAGDKVQITMKFAAPVADPQIFTTDNPARVAVDIPDTRNGMTQRRVD